MTRKEDKIFIYTDIRRINLKYVIKYFALFMLDPLYKLLFVLFGKKMRQKKYRVGVCAIFKNEAPYIKEWIEYHLLVGIEHFYLYNNNSDDDFGKILQPYIDEGVVTFIEWPEIPGQISAYKNWYEHYRHECNWMSFIDLDEFICPIKDANITDWLARYAKYPIIMMYWKMFGTSGKIYHDFSQLVVEQYTHSWDKLYTATKVFYNTDYDIALFYTSMMHKLMVKYMGLIIYPINTYGYFVRWDIHRYRQNHEVDIQLNHYWSKAYNEFQEKHKRGDAVFGKSVRQDKYFLDHEHNNRTTDGKIFRFLLELKMRMQ